MNDADHVAQLRDLSATIESALLRIADSIAKHLIQRDDWTADDPCFVVDLRAAQAEILAAVAAKTAWLEEHYCSGWEEVKRLRTALRSVAPHTNPEACACETCRRVVHALKGATP